MKALNQRQKPDDLDLLMKVTKPRGWIGVGAVGVAIAMLVVWGFLGNIPSTVSGVGLIAPKSGINAVQSVDVGFVTDVLIDSGSNVTAGDPVLTMKNESGINTVRAPFTGDIGLVFVSVGNVIEVGTVLYLLERTDSGNSDFFAYVYVDGKNAASIAPGMSVDLAVEGIPAQAFGVLRGKVSKVDAEPVSRAAITRLSGDTDFAEQVAAIFGEPILIAVSLIPDDSTASGFEWSNSDGPPFKIPFAARVSATISQGDVHPIKLVFG
jgi:multidrug efflux pump subunit AcrA (membrane-fusion protein)